MKQMKQKILSLFLVLLMLCAAALPASAATSATASNMRLAQYTGTVNVTNSSGRAQSKRSNMQLYNGYNVETKAKSYAWISLDSTKLIKLDASSKVQIRKSGDKLELLLTSGHIYFNVTSPLTQGETLNIRTSTTVTGIRGTSGCINVIDRWTSEIYILEGSVQVNVTDPVSGQIKTTTVESGQKAVAAAYPQEREGDKCDFVREQIEVEDIRGFVLEELAQDPELCREIYEASGLDVQEAAEGARERLARDERELQDKLDGIGIELAGQDSGVSSDSVWEQDNSEPDPGSGTPDGGTGSGGGTSGTPGEGEGGGDTADDMTMPKTAEEVLALLKKYDTVTLKAGNTGENTLTVENNMMTIPQGKTLTLSEGIDVTVKSGCAFMVDGTMTGKGTLTIEDGGELIVNSSNALEMRRIENHGALINNKGGKIAAEILTTSDTAVDYAGEGNFGYFASAGAIQGTVTITGGIFEITGGEIISSSSDATVSCTGGKLNLAGGMITNDGSGRALRVESSGDGSTLDGTVLRAAQPDIYSFDGSFPEPEGYYHTFGGGYYCYTRENGESGPVEGSWSFSGGTLTISDTKDMEGYNSGDMPPWNGYNEKITSVIIADSVKSIGAYAFYNCGALTGVTIPVTVTSIGNHAFSNCAALTEVYYGGTREQWEELQKSVGENNGPLTAAKIYCNSTGPGTGSLITDL